MAGNKSLKNPKIEKDPYIEAEGIRKKKGKRLNWPKE